MDTWLIGNTMSNIKWNWETFRPCNDYQSQMPQGCEGGIGNWGYCPCKVWSEGVTLCRAKLNYGYVTSDHFKTWMDRYV